MSSLTWMNASPFFEPLLNGILFSTSILCRKGTLLKKVSKHYYVEKRMAPEIVSSGAFYKKSGSAYLCPDRQMGNREEAVPQPPQ